MVFLNITLNSFGQRCASGKPLDNDVPQPNCVKSFRGWCKQIHWTYLTAGKKHRRRLIKSRREKKSSLERFGEPAIDFLEQLKRRSKQKNLHQKIFSITSIS